MLPCDLSLCGSISRVNLVVSGADSLWLSRLFILIAAVQLLSFTCLEYPYLARQIASAVKLRRMNPFYMQGTICYICLRRFDDTLPVIFST